MENEKSNAGKKTGSRHDPIIVKLASALYCLIGKASYELLQVNLGTALPSVATLQRSIGKGEKMKEGDKELLISVQEAVDHAVANDGESDENVPEDTVTAEGTISSSSSSENSENGYTTFQEIITVREDLSQLRLRKTSDESNIFPAYGESDSRGSCKSKSYRVPKSLGNGKEKSPFVLYDGTYIRKTTALYLLQENTQLSSDRLRVRAVQPNHVFVGSQQDVSSSRRSIAQVICVFLNE